MAINDLLEDKVIGPQSPYADRIRSIHTIDDVIPIRIIELPTWWP
jgi:hypothetical protein